MQASIAYRAQPVAVKATSSQARSKASSSRVMILCESSQRDSQMASRRAALGVLTAALVGMTAVQSAQAGGAPKSATAASSSGYNMEGTKHMGVSSSRKAKLLARVRERAASQKSTPAPSPAE